MSRPVDPRLLIAAPAARRLLVGYALLQLIGAVLTVGQAAVLAELVVDLVHRLPAVLSQLVLLAAFSGGRALVAAAQEWLGARGSSRVRRQLRAAVLGAVRRLGPAWAQRQPSGRLVTAAGAGLEGMDGYLSRGLPAVVAGAVVPACVLAWLLHTDWRSGVILVLVLPLVPLFMALIGITTGRRMQQQYETLARLSGHFLDLVSGLTTLRVYGRAERQVQTVRVATQAYRRQTMATLRTAFLSGLVLDLVATLSVAVVAVDVGLRLDHGSLALAPALVVLLLTPELFAPLRAMGAQHHATEEGRTAAAAALDLIDEADAPGRQSAVRSDSPDTALHDVTVTYPDRDRPALHEVSLRFQDGELVVLRGRSGAGKSTLLACLLGFAAPDTGTVSTPSAEHIAWLPQRPRPTQPTAAAEVALGDPTASDAEIAAALASCHAPAPTTALGEDGTQVSAGQRRRIALARALLRARRTLAAGVVPLVLLDEPSEDLDAATERVVVSVLGELAGLATVVVATHSDAVTAAADRVIDLADGSVVADSAGTAIRPAVVAQIAAATPARRPRLTNSGRTRSLLPVRATVRMLAIAGGLSAIAGLAGLALTGTSLWLICRASQHPNVQALEVAVVGVRTFALGRALLRYLERLVSHDGALRLLADVRARVFAALAPLVPTGIDLRRGDLLRRFVTDVDGVQEGLVRAVVPLLGAAITCTGAVALAALLVPGSGAVLAGGLLVGLVGAPLLARAVAGPGRRAAELAAERDAAVSGLLDGLAELTAYGAVGRTARAIAATDAAVHRAARRPATGAALGVATAGLASAVTLPAVLGIAATAVRDGRLSGVSAAVLVACVLAGFDALAGVPAACAAWARFAAGSARLRELLATPVPVPEPDVPATPPTTAIALELAAVAVAPAADAPSAVDDVDLHLTPGRRVAVIGPSGCGKTTLLAASLRLLPTRAGTIALRGAGTGDVPLEQLAAADVPPLVAGSLQGDHVFAASLRDNLRVVRPDADEAALDAVAARAGLTELIRRLPAGWDTFAGPDGAALSGGQRQRLLLARALLADPYVLVLDEPTAHLDADTEREILADLLDATSGRTVLMSTHRQLPAGAVDQVLDLRRDLRPTDKGHTLPAAERRAPTASVA